MTIDTRIAPDAHPTGPASTHPGTFDPAAWLADYTALGGGYAVTDTGLRLCWSLEDQTRERLDRINSLIDALTEGNKAEIRAHLTGEASPAWRDLVERYETDRDTLTTHPYGRTLPGDPAYEALSKEADALTDQSERSLQAVIAAPAPDHAAWRRKIEIAAAEYGDGCNVFDHLLADMDRLAKGNDSAILAAWERRRAAYERYNALPYSDSAQIGDLTPEEKAEWAEIDAAEAVIRESVAHTPEGAAIQLWIGLQHTLTKRDEEGACLRRDLAWFDAKDDELDWSARLIVAALRSLQAMEA